MFLRTNLPNDRRHTEDARLKIVRRKINNCFGGADNGVLEDLAADPPWFSRSETVKGRFMMGKDFWDRCATL